MDLADGEFRYGRNPVVNAIRIKNESKNKWYAVHRLSLFVSKQGV